jgi:general L-amino acid transport system permease protein
MSDNGSGSGKRSFGLSSWLYDEKVQSIAFQAVMIAALTLVCYFLISNTVANLDARNITTGLGYLDNEAGFEISDKFVSFSAADDYAQALLVGFLNTLFVAIVSVILATLIGTVLGVARLSGNWLVAKVALVWVELVRNVPLLLQLLFWWKLITAAFPHPRSMAESWIGIYLSNRGLNLPIMDTHPIWGWVALGFLAGVIGCYMLARYAKQKQNETGQRPNMAAAYLGMLIGPAFVIWLFGGAPTVVNWPELGRFRIEGGAFMSAPMLAMVLGLTIYTSGFIAEIVRSGIQAVSHGQSEAAAALGVSKGQALRLIVLPQALRVIVPPITSQYLNITKNSSLGVAIGYQEIASITNTTLNQTGQAIEAIGIMMIIYLAISLSTSAFMNWYNAQIKLTDR